MDIFAWSYQDMPGLDIDIVEHHLPLKPECPPIKKNLRRTHPDMAVKIKEEVFKQINVSFLVTSMYPKWIAYIIPITKKDRKVCMCVDYRDLNKLVQKMIFHCHILICWLIVQQNLKYSRSWMDYSDIIKSEWLLRT